MPRILVPSWLDDSGDRLASPALRIRRFIAGIDSVRKHSRHAIFGTELTGTACGGWPQHRLGTPSALSVIPGNLGSGARHDVARCRWPAYPKLHSVAAEIGRAHV